MIQAGVSQPAQKKTGPRGQSHASRLYYGPSPRVVTEIPPKSVLAVLLNPDQDKRQALFFPRLSAGIGRIVAV
jgi:hypothetical protein